MSLATTLCKGIELNVPFVSAAMDSVTEARAAIAMAREGGSASSTRTSRRRIRGAQVEA